MSVLMIVILHGEPRRDLGLPMLSHAPLKLVGGAAAPVTDEGFVSHWNVQRLSLRPPPPGCPLSTVGADSP